LDELPVGDPTLSAKELIGNESQERLGLVIAQKNFEILRAVADRERSPIYNVGHITGDDHFKFGSADERKDPIDLSLGDMFGQTPKTVMRDKTIKREYDWISYGQDKIDEYLKKLLKLEAVACKDWLTNKVDRCVSGRVAQQQTV